MSKDASTARGELSRLRLVVLTVLILMAAPSAQCCASSSFDQRLRPRSEWLGVYIGTIRLGSVHTVLDHASDDGQPVLRRTTKLQLRFGSGRSGTNSPCYAWVKYQFLASRSLEPIRRTLELHAYGAPMGQDPALRAEMTYNGGRMQVRVNSSGRQSVTTTPLTTSLRKVLRDTSAYELGMHGLRVGETITLQRPIIRVGIAKPTGDLLSFEQRESTVRVLRREARQSASGRQDLYVARETGEDWERICWLSASGEVIKEEMPDDHVTLLSETREQAAQSSLGPLPDLTAVPCDRPIPGDEILSELVVRLNGIIDPRVPCESNYRVVRSWLGRRDIEVRTAPVRFDSDVAACVPVTEPAVAEYLKPGPGVEALDSDINALAREVVGDERNSCLAARALLDWVYTNIAYDSSRHALSAAETLEERRGDCTGFALLYAALARSAGIPTRLVAGLVYSEADQAFRKHAWVESYAGEWLPADPAVSHHVVDGTYIGLLHGTDSSLFSANLNTLGISATVISCSTMDR